METFSALLAICEGNPPATGGFSSQRPVTRSFDFFFICALTSGWANVRDPADSIRNRAHYDVVENNTCKITSTSLREKKELK